MQTFVFISKYFCKSFGAKKKRLNPLNLLLGHQTRQRSFMLFIESLLFAQASCLNYVAWWIFHYYFFSPQVIWGGKKEYFTIITTKLQYLPGLPWGFRVCMKNMRAGLNLRVTVVNCKISEEKDSRSLAHRQAGSEINGAGSADADSHQHKSPSRGSWNVTFHT